MRVRSVLALLAVSVVWSGTAGAQPCPAPPCGTATTPTTVPDPTTTTTPTTEPPTTTATTEPPTTTTTNRPRPTTTTAPPTTSAPTTTAPGSSTTATTAGTTTTARPGTTATTTGTTATTVPPTPPEERTSPTFASLARLENAIEEDGDLVEVGESTTTTAATAVEALAGEGTEVAGRTLTKDGGEAAAPAPAASPASAEEETAASPLGIIVGLWAVLLAVGAVLVATRRRAA